MQRGTLATPINQPPRALKFWSESGAARCKWWDRLIYTRMLRQGLLMHKQNRPIRGYRRHFVKGAKPLGRARGQTNSDAFEVFTMQQRACFGPKHARCCVGYYDNHKRFPNLLVIMRSHIKEQKFHRWPKEPNLAELWRKQVARGRSDNFNPESG